MSTFFQCQCFMTNNIYLQTYNLHVDYRNSEQFWKDYGQSLKSMGCCSETDRRKVTEEIQNELQRRSTLDVDSHKRKQIIKETYRPLYPHLYKLKEDFFHPEFLHLVDQCITSQSLMSVQQYLHTISEVFTEEFCTQFLEELVNFEQSLLPKGKPNTMNNYGVLLNELGFYEDFLNPLRIHYLQPITKLLFPKEGGGNLDSQKGFTVKYKVGEDVDLGYHYDNAEVTLNVCLGSNFTGGELYFGDMKTVPLWKTTCSTVEQQPYCGILHRGQQLHGALPVTSGERHNLVIWMRSSSIRNRLCPMCDRIPILVPAEAYGDGFTQERQTVDVCGVF
ncbi:2-oxoglutarate and iron-dependent oxygenase domain-containing protein 2-like isoform X2 [Limulus polyphemus]|uniref:2-oxoglutarate and iron-dependent oxygenase domain-containing protein 2-like isoform X2 n=1 Tax=Limulus polyphemus TaxID=6850 RepID=A0ABM1TSI3_LIMPO|nr:2-oxoglutarate and iron-dependent oxygenase domain-containing protein 2-like isoform X2 [Limulus polyphemus]